MRRRALGLVLAAGLLGCSPLPRSPLPGHDLPPATAAAVADARWLDRLTWGATPSALAELRRLGRDAWLQHQLKPPADAALPADAQAQVQALGLGSQTLTEQLRAFDAQSRAANALTDATERQAAQQAYQRALARAGRDAATRRLLHALHGPSQLQEQLTAFWFNHFSVHQHKGNLRAMVADYEDTLRRHALGRFRDLLGAAVLHPAMLRYLDNEQNVARRINENLARELLELHTLGVDGGYTQRDVQELARVLTGLGVSTAESPPRLPAALQPLHVRRGAMEFNPARHDSGPKSLLGLQVQGSGLEGVEQVLDHLARHPSTARHVSHRLALAFVADPPPPALVERMAARWARSDGELAAVLRTMIESPEFEASLGQRFKDPQQFVLSALRLAYGDKVLLNPGPVLGWLGRLGQAPYNRSTPDGYPLDEAAWSGPGQLAARFDVARAIGSGSAGLFKTEGPPPAERAAFPQLANALFHEAIAPRLSAATRRALDQAATQADWNTLLLASPEFMHR